MKYTGRFITLGIMTIISTVFKLDLYFTQGYIHMTEWLISFISFFPVYWVGLQIDKGSFYAKELKKKDDELNEIFNIVSAVIYSFDYRTQKLLVSSRVYELYGYNSNEFKKNPNLWKEVVYSEDREIISELEQSFKKGNEKVSEYRIVLPNGEIKWIQKRVTPVLDSAGNLIKLNGVDIDINHRKKHEEILHQSQEGNRKLLIKRLEETEQRFKSLFVHNSDAILTFNLDGKLVDSNQAAEKLIGFSKNAIQNMKWQKIIDPDDVNLVREYFYIVKSKKKPQQIAVSVHHQDGKKRNIGVKMIPIIIDSDFFGVYVIAKDITESKMAEEMIRRSEKLSVVGQLAAGVAHEVRNPLTTLKGFIQFLKPNIDKHFAAIMLDELERINLIVSEFLILSKPQGVKYQDRDLIKILKNIISFLEAQTNMKNIQIIFDINLDNPIIKCDENQLKQVFINLLKNAIEAMPNSGEIIVRAQRIDDMVSIKIIDQGIGIPEEQISKLGEPFYTTKEEGTGLGLMVCYRIIENHGGYMKCFSEADKGTTFDVCLPIKGEYESEG